MHNNSIISGSEDKSIKIWDISNGNCIKTLNGHSTHVMSVAINNNKIISGSRGGSIKIWE
jgi:WD40 repeat protein